MLIWAAEVGVDVVCEAFAEDDLDGSAHGVRIDRERADPQRLTGCRHAFHCPRWLERLSNLVSHGTAVC